MKRFRSAAAVAVAVSVAALAAGQAQAETMPQMDFANPLLTSQVVWGALIFAGFYFAAARWGLPKVTEVLELRARTIEGDLDQARHDKQAADAAIAALTAERRQAQASGQAEIARATDAARAEAAQRAEADEARLEARLAESEARIAEARLAALGALREVAGETARAIVSRLTGGMVDGSSVDRAVGEALAAREAA